MSSSTPAAVGGDAAVVDPHTVRISLGATLSYVMELTRRRGGELAYGDAKGTKQTIERIAKGEMPQLGQGWSYFTPTARELSRCVASAAATAKAVKACSTEQKILGLCE